MLGPRIGEDRRIIIINNNNNNNSSILLDSQLTVITYSYPSMAIIITVTITTLIKRMGELGKLAHRTYVMGGFYHLPACNVA